MHLLPWDPETSRASSTPIINYMTHNQLSTTIILYENFSGSGHAYIARTAPRTFFRIVLSSLRACGNCLNTAVLCQAITQQRPLYSQPLRGRRPASCVHVNNRNATQSGTFVLRRYRRLNILFAECKLIMRKMGKSDCHYVLEVTTQPTIARAVNFRGLCVQQTSSVITI